MECIAKMNLTYNIMLLSYIITDLPFPYASSTTNNEESNIVYRTCMPYTEAEIIEVM